MPNTYKGRAPSKHDVISAREREMVKEHDVEAMVSHLATLDDESLMAVLSTVKCSQAQLGRLIGLVRDAR